MGYTFLITGYDEKVSMFTAKYRNVEGYVKGTGLQTKTDTSWQDISKDALIERVQSDLAVFHKQPTPIYN